MEEVKAEVKVFHTSRETPNDPISRMVKHYSCWYRLKKGVAWMLRLKKLLRKRLKDKDDQATPVSPRDSLTVSELREAEREVLKFVQREAFDDVQSKRSKLRKLNPILNANGVLRVGGRLRNSNLPDQTKHQDILPKKHHVVDLIVRHYHHLTGHSGSERVLTEIRQKFWIVKARIAVRRNITKCMRCRKRNAQPMTKQMADLPTDRGASPRAAFSHVGLDYFGPYHVKRGRSLIKRYGCIFTCLTTRAIHIEVAENLTTDSFINALQRFISRRGTPIKIRSDNGTCTNFVGAQKELKDAIKAWNLQQTDEYMRQRELICKFNPPAVSHMGGVWERQIRSVRKVLDGIMKLQNLTDDTLHTMMCLVEAIINGRPLTKLSDDPVEPITSNHSLLLRPGLCLPPGLFDETDLYRRQWRQVQYLADVFWHRWRKEYLTALQERQKWCHASQNLSPDDLVLIVDDRNSWSLGRVIETYPGKKMVG
ncbi:uncharacterized protein LOC135496115 [Lineus longissimus]|uniref:uncharacterized protein LOC135496115 n=1 Tax=Lineus longissimus TaxID=88925 RepID=UPI00315CAB6B